MILKAMELKIKRNRELLAQSGVVKENPTANGPQGDYPVSRTRQANLPAHQGITWGLACLQAHQAPPESMVLTPSF